MGVKRIAGATARDFLLNLLCRPDPQQPSQRQQLSDMIRIVVDDEDSFAQKILSVSPRKRGNEIVAPIAEYLNQGIPVRQHRRNRSFPCIAARRFGGFGPVALRKWQLLIDPVVIGAEAENVILRNPDVLQQLPCGVRQPRFLSTFTGRKICDHIFEERVSIAASERRD